MSDEKTDNMEQETPKKRAKKKTASKKSFRPKVDWQKLLAENEEEYVVLNQDTAYRYKKIPNKNLTRAQEKEFLAKNNDDKFKLILLQFFKDLLHEEGFQSVEYSPIGNGTPEYAGLSCKITWENGKVTSGIGDAHYNNATSFTKYYCGPIAENRSFVRAIKNYFNISLLGKDEVGEIPEEDNKSSSSNEAPTGPQVTLKKRAKEYWEVGDFEDFKQKLREKIKEEPDTQWIDPASYGEWKEYDDWSSVPSKVAATLVGKIVNSK